MQLIKEISTGPINISRLFQETEDHWIKTAIKISILIIATFLLIVPSILMINAVACWISPANLNAPKNPPIEEEKEPERNPPSQRVTELLTGGQKLSEVTENFQNQFENCESLEAVNKLLESIVSVLITNELKLALPNTLSLQNALQNLIKSIFTFAQTWRTNHPEALNQPNCTFATHLDLFIPDQILQLNKQIQKKTFEHFLNDLKSEVTTDDTNHAQKCAEHLKKQNVKETQQQILTNFSHIQISNQSISNAAQNATLFYASLSKFGENLLKCAIDDESFKQQIHTRLNTIPENYLPFIQVYADDRQQWHNYVDLLAQICILLSFDDITIREITNWELDNSVSEQDRETIRSATNLRNFCEKLDCILIKNDTDIAARIQENEYNN